MTVNNKKVIIDPFTLVGIWETGNNSIEMYPNPASTILYFRNLTSDASIFIYDLQGRKILSRIITDNQADLSDMANGLYIIHIMGNNNTVVKKLIKK